MLLTPGAQLIWTRGPSRDDPTAYTGHPSDLVRGVLAASDFEEEAFVRPGEESFSVGVHRFVGTPRPLTEGTKLFTFVR